MDKDGKSNTDNLRDTIVKALNNEKVTVKVQSLSSKDAPPAMILLPEQMRRINDMGAYMEQKMPGLPEYHVLLINKEHPLIVGLKITGNKIIIDKKDPIENPLASKIANHVYDMAKLSVGLDQEQIINLQNNNAELISELLNSTNCHVLKFKDITKNMSRVCELTGAKANNGMYSESLTYSYKNCRLILKGDYGGKKAKNG